MTCHIQLYGSMVESLNFPVAGLYNVTLKRQSAQGRSAFVAFGHLNLKME